MDLSTCTKTKHKRLLEVTGLHPKEPLMEKEIPVLQIPEVSTDDEDQAVDARLWELFYKPDHKKKGVNANFVMCRVCYLDINKPSHEDDFTTDYLLNHVKDCTGTAKQFAEILKIPQLVYLYEQKVFEGNPKFFNLSDHLRKISQMDSFLKMGSERLATILKQQPKTSETTEEIELDDTDVTVTNQTTSLD